jgi:hypothetical protein
MISSRDINFSLKMQYLQEIQQKPKKLYGRCSHHNAVES